MLRPRAMSRFFFAITVLVLLVLAGDASAQQRFRCGVRLIEGRDTSECTLDTPTWCSGSCREQATAFCFSASASREGVRRRCGATMADCTVLLGAERLLGRTPNTACAEEAAPQPVIAVAEPRFFCPARGQNECVRTLDECQRRAGECVSLVTGWCADSPSHEPHCYRSRAACVEALPQAWVDHGGAACEQRSVLARAFRETPSAPVAEVQPQVTGVKPPDGDDDDGAYDTDEPSVGSGGRGRTRGRAVRSGGSVRVRGYFRRNGTFVRPHTRRR